MASARAKSPARFAFFGVRCASGPARPCPTMEQTLRARVFPVRLPRRAPPRLAFRVQFRRESMKKIAAVVLAGALATASVGATTESAEAHGLGGAIVVGALVGLGFLALTHHFSST